MLNNIEPNSVFFSWAMCLYVGACTYFIFGYNLHHINPISSNTVSVMRWELTKYTENSMLPERGLTRQQFAISQSLDEATTESKRLAENVTKY